MLQPALLGALFIGVLSALPIINIANCCCLWIVGGGAVAGHLAQGSQSTRLSPGRGALVGLLAGVLGAFVWLAAAIVLDLVMGPLQERLIGDVIRDAADMPPEVRAWLEMAGDNASAPLRLAVGFILQMATGVMFAPLGGLLAVVLGGRRARAEVIEVPPPVPPQ